MSPDPTSACGPYTPNSQPNIFDVDDASGGSDSEEDNDVTANIGFGGAGNHDTIGMIAIDADGNVASGTSTNGATFKISG